MQRASRRRSAAAAVVCALTGATMAGGAPAHAQTAPSSARNVVLCHGEPPPCETSDQANDAGDEHVVTALVTDASGAPVADVPVELREEGQGGFTTGGDALVVTTGADGKASATVTAYEPGSSLLWAEISPPGTPGGFRGPAPADDACEQPAGAGGEPVAGNCVAGPLGVEWTAPPPVTDRRVTREVTLAFSDWTRDRVVVFGRVRNVSFGPPECYAGVPVRILRRSDGEWVRLATVTTSREGRYVVTLPDRPGRHRAWAVGLEPGYVDGAYTTCQGAKRAKPHRHAS